MSNIKDLFKSFRAQKAYVSKSLNDLEPGVESADFTKTTLELQNQTVPYVDYSKPENFVFYGSAEQYYRDAFNYIRQEYPYDGSGKEKNEWDLAASGFDKYIYEKKYPRTNGYVTIGKDARGLPTADGYWTPSRTEFIYFEGGPHPAPQIAEGAPVKNFFPAAQGSTPGSNYYNEEINQQSNLEINGEPGISLEFWLDKDGFVAADESDRQIICDLWNSGTWGNADYGRFRVELSGTAAGEMPPNFHIELLSGSSGFSSGQISDPNPTLIMSASSLTGSWNHFALTFENHGASMNGQLYQNGNLVYSITTGSTMGIISGPMMGQIGSLIAPVSGNQGARSFGLLSASLDEFRFWKTRRTAQQIGMNWFTQINGGTNTDFKYEDNATTKYSFTNPVDLGFYYKFNEGITDVISTDSIVLDYSGRLTNGAWTGYGAEPDQRILESAMVEAGASKFEYKDPILYSYNPNVSSMLNTLVQEGFNYDINNNASIYQSIPGWIRDEDVINNRNVLLKLTQVIASYFDRLQLQIESLPHLKDVSYISSSYKPIPFADRLIDSTGLTSTELFNEAKAFEKLVSRDDFRLFSEKLDDTKNRIYQNIYNNLVYIFKSKGAEKSFRSLIRCYGIGDELVSLNLYGDEVTYTIKENFESTVTRKRFANFFSSSNFDASVYQSTGAIANANERSFISSSINSSFQGNTFEVETYFPRSDITSKVIETSVEFITSSLFGLHTADPNTPGDTTWFTPDSANFQAYAVRDGFQNSDAFFMLTGTAGGVFPLLTSSIHKNVYDNKKWNLAVRVKPTKYPWSAAVQGSEATTYDVEFLGYDTTLDIIENQFKVTGTVSLESGQSFLTSSKRAYVGAHRTNFTGSVLEQSDVRVGSVRYWLDYLDDKTILAHSKDSSNYGRYHPGQNTFLNQFGNNFGSEVTQVPEIETLALQWTFDQVTSSNAAGEFFVGDYSAGSLAETSSYGWLGPLVDLQHPGKGIDFPTNNSDVAIREYIYTAKQQPPENLNSGDMVNIKTIGDQEVYTVDSRPIRYFFAVEKSMNAIVSSEMIKLFATVLDFNNLIGEPVNRYRQDYKAMEKIRELFFRRVQNPTVDFEKFVDYFKWIDDTIVTLLAQLFPVSANFSNKIFTMIESHVLERNKYWNKFPTLEMNRAPPEVGLYGISEMLYPYRRGSAPIPMSQSVHCVWAHDRAESDRFPSGDSTIDTQRGIFREANDFRPTANPPTLTDIGSGTPTQYQGSTYALRNFTKIYRLKADEMAVLRGGSNVVRIKNVEYAHAELPFGSSTQLKVLASEIESDIDCTDVVDPNDKVKLRYKLTNNPIGYKSGRGDIFAPFSLYSSSVDTGYATQLAGNIGVGTDITNYHDDFYGDKETPAQGPFTEKYVGGREYRHVPFWTPPVSRPEAWNLELDSPFPNIKSFRFGERPLANPGAAIELNDTFFENGVSGSWSVSLWRKVEPEAYDPFHVHPMISRTALNAIWWDTTDFGFLIDTNGGGYTRVGIMATSGYEEATSNEVPANLLMDGNWHLLVCGYDQANSKMWLDIDNGTWTDENVFVGTSLVPPDGNCKMSIGTYWDGAAGEYLADEQWSGSLDEIGLWSTALSDPALIAEIWNNGCPANLLDHSQAGRLSSWYRMGDSPGDDASPGGTMIDVLGNNDGECKNTNGNEIVDDVACNTGASSGLTLTPRTIHQPRSTLLREPLAKRPVNIRNIRQTTGSTIIGNYTHDYEIIQTSGRMINNRFFVKNGGFDPVISQSAFIPGVVDYKLPDYNLYGGPTDWIFVERFNAPGGPEVSPRGAMDMFAEEYAVYNNLNVRNLIVRSALQDWQTSYNGQFGIDSSRQVSVSGSMSIIGPGEPEGFRQVRSQNYNTLASYHKVNRNAGKHYVWSKDFSREVEFVELKNIEMSNFNRTLAANISYGTALSHQEVRESGYIECEIDINSNEFAFALDQTNRVQTEPDQVGWDYQWHFVAPGDLSVYDNNNGVAIREEFGVASIGDRLRIVKNKAQIIFQYKSVSSNVWVDWAFGTVPAAGNYHPRIALDQSITNCRISNPRYDNWFVQHPIPQDRLQYAWINKSYDKSVDQPFGHLGSGDGGKTNFSIPSGSTSIGAPQIQFVSASDFGSYVVETGLFAGYRAWGKNQASSRGFLPTDFVGLNSNVAEPINSSTNTLGYPLGTAWWNVFPSASYLNRTMVPIPAFITTVGPNDLYGLNAILLHRNGPYGHPSWKQIRTGETPVARHQKKNNVITVGPHMLDLRSYKKQALAIMRDRGAIWQPNLVELGFDSTDQTHIDLLTKIHRFVEPPVTFKYRALETRFLSGREFWSSNRGATNYATSSVQHTFCNNLYYYANSELTLLADPTSWVQGYDPSTQVVKKRPLQIHDALYKQPNMIPRFRSLIYSEVIYPKEVNTGLNKIRSRVDYAEDNPTTSENYAIADYGSNGIDRNSSERRSFWSSEWY